LPNATGSAGTGEKKRLLNFIMCFYFVTGIEMFRICAVVGVINHFIFKTPLIFWQKVKVLLVFEN
jgi:hypothetical protein